MTTEIITVQLQVKNQKVRDDLKGLISSLEGFCLQKPDDPDPEDVLILEIGDEPQREFQVIRSLQDAGAIREIFVTSPRVESDLVIQALREGVKEFIPQPIKTEDVTHALLKSRERKESSRSSGKGKKRGKIIDIIGSKGGVGTTTIAVNLAISLAESAGSPSVGLIDMNLLFGEIPLFLDVKPVFNWGEVARNISRLDSTYLMSVLSRHPSGVHVLPSPTELDGIHVATPEVIEKLLNVMQSVFDFIVIDGGQTLDDLSLRVLEAADMVFPVAVLSLPCLSNLKRLLWTFQTLGFPREENVKIIISRHHKKSEISVKETETTLNKKIFWLIPNDYPTTMSAINQGKPLSTVAHGAEITKSLNGLSSSFLEKEKRREEKTGFWNYFSK